MASNNVAHREPPCTQGLVKAARHDQFVCRQSETNSKKCMNSVWESRRENVQSYWDIEPTL